MAYKPREIEEKLISKFGFTKDIHKGSDHRYYVLVIDDETPWIQTHFSHNKKDIGADLESSIIRQLHVRKNFFHEMIDCTKSREDYIQQVKTDPFPPFPPYLTGKK